MLGACVERKLTHQRNAILCPVHMSKQPTSEVLLGDARCHRRVHRDKLPSVVVALSHLADEGGIVDCKGAIVMRQLL